MQCRHCIRPCYYSVWVRAQRGFNQCCHGTRLWWDDAYIVFNLCDAIISNKILLCLLLNCQFCNWTGADREGNDFASSCAGRARTGRLHLGTQGFDRGPWHDTQSRLHCWERKLQVAPSIYYVNRVNDSLCPCVCVCDHNNNNKCLLCSAASASAVMTRSDKTKERETALNMYSAGCWVKNAKHINSRQESHFIVSTFYCSIE